jgi:hypothetical protein
MLAVNSAPLSLCKILRHPQSQGSVERVKEDIRDMTVTWMRENNCKDWQVGIKFVQFQKNLSYHSGIKRTPYKAICFSTNNMYSVATF